MFNRGGPGKEGEPDTYPPPPAVSPGRTQGSPPGPCRARGKLRPGGRAPQASCPGSFRKLPSHSVWGDVAVLAASRPTRARVGWEGKVTGRIRMKPKLPQRTDAFPVARGGFHRPAPTGRQLQCTRGFRAPGTLETTERHVPSPCVSPRSCAEGGHTPTVTDSCVGAAGECPHGLPTSAAARRVPRASPRTFLPWHPGRGRPFAEASRGHSRRSFREQTLESGGARGRTPRSVGGTTAPQTKDPEDQVTSTALLGKVFCPRTSCVLM